MKHSFLYEMKHVFKLVFCKTLELDKNHFGCLFLLQIVLTLYISYIQKLRIAHSCHAAFAKTPTSPIVTAHHLQYSKTSLKMVNGHVNGFIINLLCTSFVCIKVTTIGFIEQVMNLSKLNEYSLGRRENTELFYLVDITKTEMSITKLK